MSSPSTSTIPRAVVFSKEQMDKIKQCLDELAGNTGTWSILLTDTTGQLIEIQGRINKKRAEAMAALMAGTYAASTEFIKILGKGKYVQFNSLSQETEDYSIFSIIVDELLILSVAFGKEVKIGIVRVFAEQARRKLLEILHDASAVDSDLKDVKLQLVGKDFDQLLSKELDTLTEFEE
jgi:predicted regulator of Ras-like GTPase activity (Roadblock/LC7/MglB family)